MRRHREWISIGLLSQWHFYRTPCGIYYRLGNSIALTIRSFDLSAQLIGRLSIFDFIIEAPSLGRTKTGGQCPPYRLCLQDLKLRSRFTCAIMVYAILKRHPHVIQDTVWMPFSPVFNVVQVTFKERATQYPSGQPNN